MTSILILQHQRPDGEVDTYHLKAGRRYHLGRGSQCQVRILDLKLSRQHCAFEHTADGWHVFDLASTNGCTLDGEPVRGSLALKVGSVIAAGSTAVTIAGFSASDQEPVAPSNRPEDTPPGQLPSDSGPPAASERLAAAVSRSAEASDELEPHAQPNRSTISDPLIPGIPVADPRPAALQPRNRDGATPMPAAVEAPAPGLDHDVLATMTPGAGAAASPALADIDNNRSFFISVLGKRVGPLTRQQARELKARELKGTLTPADLAAIEAVAAAQAPAEPAAPPTPPPASAPARPSADEQATYYITLLGKRVGPLTRTQARELKARELRGQLAPADIAHLAAR